MPGCEYFPGLEWYEVQGESEERKRTELFAKREEAAQHEYQSLARVLKALLARMNRALEKPSYNLVIHSSPFSEETSEYYHWHVELMPRLTKVAGFEWGTGFYINPTSPEEAARVLRDAKV